MFFRFLFAFAVVFVISGCASGINKEVSGIEKQILSSRVSVNNSKTWLNNNSNIYNGRYCVEPSRGPEPSLSCHSDGEARGYALAFCAISYKGCDAALYSFKDELNSLDKKFLASQICQAKLAELLKENRSAEDVAVAGVIAIADDRCENGGFLGKTLGCLYSVAGKLVKAAKFMECIDRKSKQCTSNYQNWIYAPSQMKSICENKIKIIAQEEENIQRLSGDLYEKKNTLAWKFFGR